VLTSPWKSETFSGSVDDIDLFDYLQLMLLSRKQVVVEIKSRLGESGLLYLDRGNVTHAASGALEGEAAFFHCLGFDGGTFASRVWRIPERRTIVMGASGCCWRRRGGRTRRSGRRAGGRLAGRVDAAAGRGRRGPGGGPGRRESGGWRKEQREWIHTGLTEAARSAGDSRSWCATRAR